MTENNENKSLEQKEEESTIFSAPAKIETFTSKRKKGLLKKQRRAILILAILAVLIISAYTVFNMYVNHVKVLYETDRESIEGDSLAKWVLENIIRPEKEQETIELLPGEVRDTSGSILMYEHSERADIKSIEIYNEHGEYGFVYDSEYSDFFVKDHITAPYDPTLFSNLVVGTGYTVVKERVSEKCEDFSVYGLADEDNPAYYILTTKAGRKHTVYIGNPTPTGSGYYVRYKGRDAVYIFGSNFSDTVLAPLENMITPTLTLPMAKNDYFTVENFMIAKGEDIKVLITFLTDEEKEATGLKNSYQMLYPKGYNVHSTNYSKVINGLINFAGKTTLVYAPCEADMEKYGLLEPAYSLSYEYKGIKQPVVFSEKNENGNYYAYSLTFDLITEVPESAVQWLTWDTIEWVDSSIFMMNIDEVKEIKVESDTATRIYDLAGEKDELVVTERSTGFKPEVSNFRQFYKSLLCIYIQGYASEDVSEDDLSKLVSDEGSPYLTLTVKTRKSGEIVYKFYPYSTRRAYYTVNGIGEFYVLRDAVTKVITDSEKVLTNTPIDAHAHS